MKNNIDNFCSY